MIQIREKLFYCELIRDEGKYGRALKTTIKILKDLIINKTLLKSKLDDEKD
jgi:hypothetical protein